MNEITEQLFEYLCETIEESVSKTYVGSLVRDALYGEAYSARMFSDNPDLSPDAVQAYRWAEEQFIRIAQGRVDERDLIG